MELYPDYAKMRGDKMYIRHVTVGDESTALTAAAGKHKFRMPFAARLIAARASVGTAPTGAALLVDVNASGTSVFDTQKLQIDATEKTTLTAAAAPVILDQDLADDEEVSVDIDQIGSTVAGAGLKLTLYFIRL